MASKYDMVDEVGNDVEASTLQVKRIEKVGKFSDIILVAVIVLVPRSKHNV